VPINLLFRRLGVAALLAVGLASAACEREKRSFILPASAADAPADVAFQNPVRPGPPVATTTSKPDRASVARLASQRYGPRFDRQAQALSDGQALYEAFNCVGCHAHGGGGMAPPLLDEKWLYGGEPELIYASIVQGRPNGMPSFRGRIPDYQVWELVAYVRSLSGHANPNAASGREDHLRAQPPPNSMPPQPQKNVPAPTTGPVGNSVQKS
jgi:cytochrome c oxidase cbb3-type subunit 3